MAESAFTRGASSALDLFGVSQKEDLDFTYNGKDLRSESTTDVIEDAWGMLGSLMSEFCSKDSGEK
jgi:hypothetical protein